VQRIVNQICENLEHREEIPDSVEDGLPDDYSIKVSLRWHGASAIMELHSADGAGVTALVNLGGRLNRSLVATTSECVAQTLVKRVRISAMITRCDNQHSGPPVNEPRFGCLHQQPTNSASLVVRRHSQRHDLAVAFVRFVERANARPDEAHHFPALVARDQSLVIFIAKDRIEPCAHLVSPRRITQLTYQSR
jgi:hypothetical protein